jgi:homoserine kinase type II
MAFLPAPKVTGEDIEDHLSRFFDLGRFLSYKKLKKGFANSLYHIKTSKGDYVFKIAIRNNPDKVQYEIDLLTGIRGLPVPQPIKTKNGKYLFDFKGHKTFIYTFLPGREEKKFTKRMLFEVGEFLGKLHLQTDGFASPVERTDFYSISAKKLRRVIEESRRIKNAKVRRAVLYLEKNALGYKLPAGLPKGAMHIDMKPENVLFAKGRLTGVVDFDNSYIGPLVFDLADTLMWFCSKGGLFDTMRAKAIYKGYESARKLNPPEREALFDALHNVYLAISLCGVDYLAQKKLPERFVVWVIDNLLETEKNFQFTKEEFSSGLQ